VFEILENLSFRWDGSPVHGQYEGGTWTLSRKSLDYEEDGLLKRLVVLLEGDDPVRGHLLYELTINLEDFQTPVEVLTDKFKRGG
jgi:hypothetical protein